MADWDVSNPADNAVISQYPANARAARAAVRTNFSTDHEEAVGDTIGMHKLVRLLDRSSDPASAAGRGVVYTKMVSGRSELFYRASDGSVLQMTTDGALRIPNASITSAMLRNSAALSVIGRSANSSGAPGDIAAGSDHQVLRRSGTAIGFGAVNLAQSAAVTGALPIANGGTGSTTAANARTALGLGTMATRNVTVSTSAPSGGADNDIWLQREA